MLDLGGGWGAIIGFMDKKTRRRFELNLVKYAWAQPMRWRVYLPIIGVYLVSVGGLSLVEIASITSIGAIVSLALQMPSGYFADKFGNRRALQLGSMISLTSPLWYIALPNYWGALIGFLLFTLGNLFISNGVMESLIHDTLIKLNREKEYAKLMGRAQSYGLIGNVVLVALVALTYPVSPVLPFLLGFVTQIVLFILVRSYEYPDIPRVHAPKAPIKALTSVINWRNLAVFVFFGFVASIGWSSGTGDFLTIHLNELGMAMGMLGFVQAGGSLIGAILGRVTGIFDAMRSRTYYLIDLLLAVSCLATIGLASNLVAAAIAAMIFMGWVRIRSIIFQSKLLAEMKHVYKATLISALNLFVNGWSFIAPGLLAWSVLTRGNSLAAGYVLFAAIALVVGLFLWGLIWLSRRRGVVAKEA